jgi:hypothetical protein
VLAFTLAALVSLSLEISFVGGCLLYLCNTETCLYAHPFQPFGIYRFTRSWRRTRRAAHEILTKVAVRDYHRIFRKEAILLAFAFIKNPEDLDKHIQRSSASASMSILYDYPTLESEHDETLRGIVACPQLLFLEQI